MSRRFNESGCMKLGEVSWLVCYQVLVESRGHSPERLLYADKMLWIGFVSWVGLSDAVLYGGLGAGSFGGESEGGRDASPRRL